VPAALGRLLTRSFGALVVLSTVLGAAFAVVGLYLSFWIDVPSGASIVVVGATAFGVVLLFTATTGRLRIRAARRAATDARPVVAPRA
jgi:ABC-type Mn2+/Zn2+ transport system permease subunit